MDRDGMGEVKTGGGGKELSCDLGKGYGEEKKLS